MGIRPWEHVHMTVQELDDAIDACERHLKDVEKQNRQMMRGGVA